VQLLEKVKGTSLTWLKAIRMFVFFLVVRCGGNNPLFVWGLVDRCLIFDVSGLVIVISFCLF